MLVTRAVVDAANSGLRYVPYRSNDLVMLVPDGYSDELLAGPHGTRGRRLRRIPRRPRTQRRFARPLPAGGTPQLAASRRWRRRCATRPASRSARSTRSRCPAGSRPPSCSTREARVDYAVFEYDACSRRIGVTLTLSTDDIGLLNEFEDVLPQSAYPICDGPDFSNRDRADTSVPLRS